MTNSISFAGMGSGIDFDSLRQALMLVERQSLTRITDKQSLLKQKRDAFKDIDSRMDSLKTTLSPLLDYTSTNIFNPGSGAYGTSVPSLFSYICGFLCSGFTFSYKPLSQGDLAYPESSARRLN